MEQRFIPWLEVAANPIRPSLMNISAVKTYLVEGIKYNWTLVKVETEAGIHGWGEATNWPGSPLIEAACQHVGQFVIGTHDCDHSQLLSAGVYGQGCRLAR
ncbi:MAG: hypothetical protein OXG68_17655 [Chloroflexi bacterium]|nr:hypothetical protein [Chloroflexota bacterium]